MYKSVFFLFGQWKKSKQNWKISPL